MWRYITTIFLSGLSIFGSAEYTGAAEPKLWLEYRNLDALPSSWYWGDIDGNSFLTKNLNQHLPQWCGSCWAHGAMSSLADRVKIARNGSHPDINLPVQFLLNCNGGGSCHGGSHYRAYEFIHKVGGIPFDTCLAYEACSHDSDQEVCKNRNFSCIPVNICRTSTSKGNVAIESYPNVTVRAYYALRGHANMMTEIFKHGPIACAMNCVPVMDYEGGIVDLPDESKATDHVVSIVGWGYDGERQYWVVRNSWGEFWGELGFFRIFLGDDQLGIESDCAAALPGRWSEHNKPCDLDGKNCL